MLIFNILRVLANAEYIKQPERPQPASGFYPLHSRYPRPRIKIKHVKILIRVKLLHLVKARCQNGERMSCSMLLLHRHDKAVHDAVLALRRVLAHVEIGDRPVHVRVGGENHLSLVTFS